MVQITQDKVTESVRAPEVMDGGTFGLVNTFLKYSTITIAN
jgi:hypothetical protein